MTIKTTRLKATQTPRIRTMDLSDQMNGSRQTFSLPRRIQTWDTHYLVWNSTVYRNDRNHRFYSISEDGYSLTTYFDTAPVGGAGRTLQLAYSAGGDGEDDVLTKAEVNKLVNDEAEARRAADEALGVRIDEEAKARRAADAEEKLAREQADEAERQAREAGDANLQSQLDAAAAASDVVDIVDTKAELDAYNKSALTDKDVIKVLRDETQSGATTYYRFDKPSNNFNLIGAVGPYYTQAEVNNITNNITNNMNANLEHCIKNNVSTEQTMVGDLRLKKNGSNFGTKLSFGDGDYAHIYEYDDKLRIKGNTINLATSTDTLMIGTSNPVSLASLLSNAGSRVNLYSAWSDNTDGAYTAKFIKDVLNGSSLILGEDNDYLWENSSSTINNGDAIILGRSNTLHGTSAVIIGVNNTGASSTTLMVGSGNTAEEESIGCIGGSNHTKRNSFVLGTFTSNTRNQEFALDQDGMYIANVKAGTLDTDAVNVKQMKDYVAANAGGGDTSDSRITDTGAARANNLPNYVLTDLQPSRYTASTLTISIANTNLDTGANSADEVDIQAATKTNAGIMSATDKTKLDRIPAMIIGSTAEGGDPMFAVDSVDAGLSLAYNQYFTGTDANRLPTAVIFPTATTTTNGVMSAADKAKLDGLTSGDIVREGFATLSAATGDLQMLNILPDNWRTAKFEIIYFPNNLSGSIDTTLKLNDGAVVVNTNADINMTGAGTGDGGMKFVSKTLTLAKYRKADGSDVIGFIDKEEQLTAATTTHEKLNGGMVTGGNTVNGITIPYAVSNVSYKITVVTGD